MRKPTKSANRNKPLPEWVSFEAKPIEFNLEIVDWNDGNQPVKEQIGMTADEHASLKRHLARLRGYKASKESANAA